MAGLDDQLQGVEPVAPAGEVDDNLLEEEEPKADDPGADQGDGGGDDDPKNDRTPENIYREVSRKLEKQDGVIQKFQESQERMMGMMERMTENLSRPAEPAKPDKPTGDSLDQHSVEQLKALRPNVPADKISAFDDYLNERRIQEGIEERMSVSERNRADTDTRRRSAQQAVNQFPDLQDRSSKFAQAVDQELRVRGKTYADSNPHALIDVANTVASKLGVTGTNIAGNPRIPGGRPATRDNAAPTKPKEEGHEFALSKARSAELAKNLEGAMPKGKKFNMKRVNERAKVYREHRDLFVS